MSLHSGRDRVERFNGQGAPDSWQAYIRQCAKPMGAYCISIA